MLLDEKGEYIAKIYEPIWIGVEQELSWCISEEDNRFYYWLDTASGWVCIQSYKQNHPIDIIASKFHNWDKEKIDQFLNLVQMKRRYFISLFSLALEEWEGDMTPVRISNV